jgi:hypothetical protein
MSSPGPDTPSRVTSTVSRWPSYITEYPRFLKVSHLADNQCPTQKDSTSVAFILDYEADEAYPSNCRTEAALTALGCYDGFRSNTSKTVRRLYIAPLVEFKQGGGAQTPSHLNATTIEVYTYSGVEDTQQHDKGCDSDNLHCTGYPVGKEDQKQQGKWRCDPNISSDRETAIQWDREKKLLHPRLLDVKYDPIHTYLSNSSAYQFPSPPPPHQASTEQKTDDSQGVLSQYFALDTILTRGDPNRFLEIEGEMTKRYHDSSEFSHLCRGSMTAQVNFKPSISR